jgi:Mrp family chromosome partitioning ATPase
LALAFVMELYLDRSVKRPSEIETKLGLPLFLSIPYVSAGERRRLAKTNEKLRLQWKNAESNGSVQPVGKESRLEVAPWNDSHSLRPFYEALRDRLIGHFEAKNLTRKPKLVAVTSVAKGSGASTIASGLAASLSETGDGNVLLVGMNSEHDIAQQFYKGKLGCHLDDILEGGKRDDAMVQENLYVVTEGANGNQVPRLLPKRFMAVLPKLKVSDYDYIIFDMPPITQTSVTPRLAGFMDITLMVVESEKTDRDVVRRASALLEESNAHVSIVLNKTRKYVPARLHQDFLSDT